MTQPDNRNQIHLGTVTCREFIEAVEKNPEATFFFDIVPEERGKFEAAVENAKELGRSPKGGNG